jgi:hypothetical protein
MRRRANKTETTVLEKLARSAAAIHLHEGLVYKRNYSAHEAAGYWRTYKNEPWEMGTVSVFQQDTTLASLEELLVEHDRNIVELEDRLITALAEQPACDTCNDKTRNFCSCPCHRIKTGEKLTW